jgi:hypothetical protein
MTFAAGSARALVTGLGSSGERTFVAPSPRPELKLSCRLRRVQINTPSPSFGAPTEPASASPTGGGVQHSIRRLRSLQRTAASLNCLSHPGQAQPNRRYELGSACESGFTDPGIGELNGLRIQCYDSKPFDLQKFVEDFGRGVGSSFILPK